MGVVGVSLLASGALDLYVTYRDTTQAVGELQGEKAASAAARIEGFVTGIQRQLRGALGGAESDARPRAVLAELHRILFQTPSVEDVAFLDSRGREIARASRLDPDSLGTGTDRSDTPGFRETRAKASFIGPVRSEHGSVPYVTMAESGAPGVVVAEVNLATLSDVVTEINVGRGGSAFVVDREGRLIAHPDRTLALSGRDLSALDHVRTSISNPATRHNALTAVGIDGSRVIASSRTAPTPRWPVIIEQERGAALAPVRRRIGLIAALLAIGTALAIATSVILARRMVKPIRDLQTGAKRLGAGDLNQRISVNTGDELEALGDEFNQMGARLARSLEELRASRRRLVAAQDEERRRIERDLHDGAQQHLAALRVRVNLLLHKVEGETRRMVEDVGAELNEAVETLRELAHGIYPPRLAADGLAAALSARSGRAPYALEISAPNSLGRFPPSIEAAVYFCCLEAMQNATKYAEASTVRITLGRREGGLLFEVTDDGRGFNVAEARGGAGTQNMRDRIDALGGELTIRSSPGAGTTVSGWIPVAEGPTEKTDTSADPRIRAAAP
ncbi:MAG TPA: cache domain-containing protein [Microvirga sp.]|nr:cache domain-containing protein [Microvirga sp.]